MNSEEKHLDPAIHRVRLDKLTIFEITEAELDALEGTVRNLVSASRKW
jgi:hypothetical protein